MAMIERCACEAKPRGFTEERERFQYCETCNYTMPHERWQRAWSAVRREREAREAMEAVHHACTHGQEMTREMVRAVAKIEAWLEGSP